MALELLDASHSWDEKGGLQNISALGHTTFTPPPPPRARCNRGLGCIFVNRLKDGISKSMFLGFFLHFFATKQHLWKFSFKFNYSTFRGSVTDCQVQNASDLSETFPGGGTHLVYLHHRHTNDSTLVGQQPLTGPRLEFCICIHDTPKPLSGPSWSPSRPAEPHGDNRPGE